MVAFSLGRSLSPDEWLTVQRGRPWSAWRPAGDPEGPRGCGGQHENQLQAQGFPLLCRPALTPPLLSRRSSVTKYSATGFPRLARAPPSPRGSGGSSGGRCRNARTPAPPGAPREPRPRSGSFGACSRPRCGSCARRTSTRGPGTCWPGRRRRARADAPLRPLNCSPRCCPASTRLPSCPRCLKTPSTPRPVTTFKMTWGRGAQSGCLLAGPWWETAQIPTCNYTRKVLAPAVGARQVRPRPGVPGQTERAFAHAREGVRARRAGAWCVHARVSMHARVRTHAHMRPRRARGSAVSSGAVRSGVSSGTASQEELPLFWN